MSKIVKSFASHYILLPNAELGKWPVISINSNGEILSVEKRDNFTERPSLEMHPGIIVPAFIDIANNQAKEEININLHHAKGTLIVNDLFTIKNKCDTVEKKIKESAKPSFIELNNKPILERIIEYQTTENTNITESLYWATQWGAEQTNLSKKVGKLEVGYSPGIIVIQNIDLAEKRITNYATIKWLNKPIL